MSVVGTSCQTSDPEHYCLAVKYVSYKNAAGQPVSTQDQAIRSIAEVNQIWSQCNLGFQLENYQAISPEDYRLVYGTATSASQTTEIREAFSDSNTLLWVVTGPWGTVKNAWTTLPGDAPYGMVVEASVAEYAPIAAHELGHYLNLDHVNDTQDLMNPVIYRDPNRLTLDQCEVARDAVRRWWGQMLR